MVVSLAIFFAIGTDHGCAQRVHADSAEVRYGGFLHLNLNLHRAGFSRLPGVPNCCQEFTGASGLGVTVGGIYQIPLSYPLLLNLRGGYSLLSSDFAEPEGITVIINGDAVEGEFEHQLDAGLSAVLFEPSLGWRLSPGFGLRGGIGIGYVLGGTFDQREVLVKPEETGLFENNRRTRNEFEGDIPDLNRLLLSAHLGVGYDFPLNEEGSLLATPEIGYSRGFSPIVIDSSWSVDQLRVGVAVTFGSRPAMPEPMSIVTTPTQPDTVVSVITPEPLLASVTVVGIREDGSEVPITTLHVEEFISTNMRPLLNYVFFAEKESRLPERYKRLNRTERDRFRVESLHNVPTLPTYHHLLNIVGRRMQEYPDAHLSIIGCNDGLEEKEDGGLELSIARARTVADYLREAWDIDTSRLLIEARDLPEKPSNMTLVDGVIENRRVELYSDAWEVLAPVVTVDTLRLTNPPAIRFRPVASGPNRVKGWRLRVMQSGKLLKEFNDSTGVPDRINWNLQGGQESVPRADAPLKYQFEATDQRDVSGETPGHQLPVEQVTISEKRRERVADKYIDRYSLILFDFDKAAFNEANDRIAAFIRERLREGATLTITGYTDRIGEDDYNLRLSQRRAEQTAKELEIIEGNVAGLGETVELHENDLPEGRFYSRTVTIIVETLIE